MTNSSLYDAKSLRALIDDARNNWKARSVQIGYDEGSSYSTQTFIQNEFRTIVALGIRNSRIDDIVREVSQGLNCVWLRCPPNSIDQARIPTTAVYNFRNKTEDYLSKIARSINVVPEVVFIQVETLNDLLLSNTRIQSFINTLEAKISTSTVKPIYVVV